MSKSFWILLIVVGTLGALIFATYDSKTICTISRIDADMSALKIALMAYNMEYNSLPLGDNKQICAALAGDNPKKIRFIELSKPQIAPNGEFLDPWGTPYKFYISKGELLIRSAGKNKVFEDSSYKTTSDDYYKSTAK